jgi:hypothetical protein
VCVDYPVFDFQQTFTTRCLLSIKDSLISALLIEKLPNSNPRFNKGRQRRFVPSAMTILIALASTYADSSSLFVPFPRSSLNRFICTCPDTFFIFLGQLAAKCLLAPHYIQSPLSLRLFLASGAIFFPLTAETSIGAGP